MVLNIPIGDYEANPQIEDLIGYQEILQLFQKFSAIVTKEPCYR
jgi:hypothetical protein